MPQPHVFQSTSYTDAQGNQQYGVNPSDVDAYEASQNHQPTRQGITGRLPFTNITVDNGVVNPESIRPVNNPNIPPYGTDDASLQRWADENPEAFDTWADREGYTGQTNERSTDPNVDRVMSALNSGYGTPEDIANNTGLTLDEVNNLINSNYNISSMLQYNQTHNEAQGQLDELTSQMRNIYNGNYQFSPDEQAQINDAQKNIEEIRRQLLLANKNYEQSTLINGIRTGTQEFMNQVATGDYNKAIQDGISKLQDYDTEAASVIAKLKQSFKDSKFKQASDLYDKLDAVLKSRTDAISEIQKKTKEYYDDIQEKVKFDLEVQKYASELQRSRETDDTKEFALAKEQGFDGDFMDYQLWQEEISKSPDKPITQQVGDTLLQWDNTTKTWQPVYQDAGSDDSSEILSVTEADALGVPYGTTKGDAYGKRVTGNLSVDEAKAAQFAVAANNANNALNASKYKLGNVENPFMPNALKSEERQAFEQAARAFVNAILRRESGATITDDEFKNKYKELVPSAGDKKSVLKQKEEARAAAVKSIQEAGGKLESLSVSQQFDNWFQTEAPDADLNKIEIMLNDPKLGATAEERKENILELYGVSSPISLDDSESKYSSKNIKFGSNLARLNNNPGNLRYVGQKGATQGKGGFAKFSSPQAGIQALKDQIKLDSSRGLTLAQFINKYAPPVENNTNLYLQQMIKATGAKASTKIKDIDLNKLARAIAKKESSSTIG